MNLPRYTEDEIKKIEEEFKKIPGKRREETEFKDVKFVSVVVGNKIPVKAHYRRVNGKRVFVRAHLRKKPRRK